MVAQRISGFVLFISFILFGMDFQFTNMVDIRSIVIVTLGTLGMLLLGGSNIQNMIKTAFSGDATDEELREGISDWRQARTYSLVAGIACVMVGTIICVANLDDPARIGPGMAIALLGTLYALLLGFGFALPIQARLEDLAGVKTENGMTSHAAMAFVFTLFLAFGSLWILLLGFSRSES